MSVSPKDNPELASPYTEDEPQPPREEESNPQGAQASLSESSLEEDAEPLVHDPFLSSLQGASADFFEAFGFKANLGRIWMTLFYSLQPLTQRELIRILQLSAGMVSQGLNELIRLGVVHTLPKKHNRETQYDAERNLAKAASLILGQRESQTIARLLERIESIQFEMTIQSSQSPALEKRLQRLEELIAILQLAQAIVALFGTFSRYSYHAMRLGVRALKHLRMIDLPQWLGNTVKTPEAPTNETDEQ